MVVRFLVLTVFLLSSCNQAPIAVTQVSVVYPTGARLMMATSGGGVGRLDLFAVTSGKVLPVLPIHTDATVRVFSNGKTVVVNRLGMDSIYVLGKGVNTIVAKTGLKKGANPQDVHFIGDTLWVTQRSEGELLKWNTVTGEKQTVSLAKLAYTDGGAPAIPDMMMMTGVGQDVWVSLQRLRDRIRPSDYSLVAVIPPTGEVRSFRLAGTNPVTAFKRDPAGNLYLGTAGSMGSLAENDGGIERLSAGGEKSEAFAITKKGLGGDIMDFEIFDETHGVALVSKPSTELLTFNPATGKVTGSVLATPGYDLVRLHWDRVRGHLYVADRRKERPAVHQYSVPTLKLIQSIPVPVPVWEMEIEEP